MRCVRDRLTEASRLLHPAIPHTPYRTRYRGTADAIGRCHIEYAMARPMPRPLHRSTYCKESQFTIGYSTWHYPLNHPQVVPLRSLSPKRSLQAAIPQAAIPQAAIPQFRKRMHAHSHVITLTIPSHRRFRDPPLPQSHFRNPPPLPQCCHGCHGPIQFVRTQLPTPSCPHPVVHIQLFTPSCAHIQLFTPSCSHSAAALPAPPIPTHI